ncbi:MAG: 3D-(3,5/4)-trihydroxycyclohexane-1,2-dione acylhydrolase (decyclizing) [Opitutaceae bacterium]|nr:3D-(3,5/4)-trihydroxycyclohexane-1,2-dione acylhydrolase (decyclizing) [Opitutaceae bacterium]
MNYYTAQDTVRLTLGQALVKFLQTQYSERDGTERRLVQGMWGILGHGNVSGLSQALVEYGQDLPFYQPCNEQSMVHASSGFARANLRLATMACTSSIGPGATNMLTGAATATVNRLPVLLLPSDYYATRFQGQVLQGLDHPTSMDTSVTDCFRVVSKFFDRITRPEQVLFSLPEAMRVLTDPAETGAVTIALPQDIQGYAFDYPVNLFEKHVWRIERRQPDAQRIEEAIALLKKAKRPFIIAGGGVHYSEAWEELATFAEKFGIPVAETHAGKGAIRNNSDLLVGGVGVTGTLTAAHFSTQADLVFCIGTRLHDFVTGSNSAFQNPLVKFIGINVCSHDAFKLGSLPIMADAREALRVLTQAGEAAGIQPDSEYVQEVPIQKQKWHDLLDKEVIVQHPGEAINQGHLVTILNDMMEPGDSLVAAAGTIPADLTKLFDSSNGRTLYLEFGNSCMGFDIPAAIGVKMVRKEGEVFILMGDGNYQLHPMELVTAIQERTKITVVLVNNGGYQSIHGHQKALVGHSLGNEFKIRDPETNLLDDGEFIDVDYVKNAESIGLKAWQATNEDEIRQALIAARAEEGSCMIVVPTEKYRYTPDADIWWEVIGAEVTEDPKTKELVEAREAGRVSQRFYF